MFTRCAPLFKQRVFDLLHIRNLPMQRVDRFNTFSAHDAFTYSVKPLLAPYINIMIKLRAPESNQPLHHRDILLLCRIVLRQSLERRNLGIK